MFAASVLTGAVSMYTSAIMPAASHAQLLNALPPLIEQAEACVIIKLPSGTAAAAITLSVARMLVHILTDAHLVEGQAGPSKLHSNPEEHDSMVTCLHGAQCLSYLR